MLCCCTLCTIVHYSELMPGAEQIEKVYSLCVMINRYWISAQSEKLLYSVSNGYVWADEVLYSTAVYCVEECWGEVLLEEGSKEAATLRLLHLQVPSLNTCHNQRKKNMRTIKCSQEQWLLGEVTYRTSGNIITCKRTDGLSNLKRSLCVCK